jgi:hypothetical protein
MRLHTWTQIMRKGQPAYYFVNKSCDPFCKSEVYSEILHTIFFLKPDTQPKPYNRNPTS